MAKGAKAQAKPKKVGWRDGGVKKIYYSRRHCAFLLSLWTIFGMGDGSLNSEVSGK